MVEILILPHQKLSPTINIGGFINLLMAYNYVQEEKTIGVNNSNFISYNNSKLNYDFYYTSSKYFTYEMNNWIFKRFVSGWHASIGLRYQINSKYALSMQTVYQNSLIDVENKVPINYRNPNQQSDYYTKNIYDYIGNTSNLNTVARPATFFQSLSTNLSFQYSFSKK